MAVNWSFISISKYRIQIYHISYQVGSTMLYYILHILYHLSIPIITGGYPSYPITFYYPYHPVIPQYHKNL